MSERITLRVSLAREDEAWLRQRAEELDLDVTAVLRMIVRQAKRGVHTAHTPDVAETRRAYEEHQRRAAAEEAERARRAAIEAKRAELRKQLAALDAVTSTQTFADLANTVMDELPLEASDDFEVPPDPDGGVASDEIGSLLAQADNLMHAASAPAAPRGGPPGSLIAPVGVNPNLRSGYAQGDARGNLTRQNFGHLGFSGGIRG